MPGLHPWFVQNSASSALLDDSAPTITRDMRKRCLVPFLVVLGCAQDGGQSGTDQFDVDRVNTGGHDDAGSSFTDPEPAPEPVPAPEPEPMQSETPPVIPEVAPICDGSAGVRFSATFGGPGGPVAFYNAFTPGRFLVIDGSCRYWLNDASLLGLRSGQLSEEEAEAFSADLHYGQYEALSFYELSQCPDGGSRSLTDGTGQLVCRCGDCSSARAELRDPFQAAEELYAELAAREEWAWGPTSVLPLVVPVEADALDWTLAFDLAEVAHEGGLEQPFSEDDGVLVPDAELEAFSELRRTSIERGNSAQLVVVDADGAGYSLFVRDEPPAPVGRALSARVHD